MSKSQELKDILSVLPPLEIERGPWLAGGAARRILENLPLDGGDLDIFFSSWSQFHGFQKAIQKISHGGVHETSFAATYNIDVKGKTYRLQLIKRKSYSSTGFLFDDFDFTVCQIATDGNKFAWEEEAIQDIDKKILRLSPGGRVTDSNLVRRTMKYINYGFRPENGLMSRVVDTGLKRVFLVGLESEDSYDWAGAEPLIEDPIDSVTI